MNPQSLAITSSVWLNYNMKFIPSSIKVLTFIDYITNYILKSNCSYLQKIKAVAIMRRSFNNYDINFIIDLLNYISIFVKFTLEIFNRSFHDWDITEPFVICYLLNSLNHYCPNLIIKIINIALLQAKFLLILNCKSFN